MRRFLLLMSVLLVGAVVVSAAPLCTTVTGTDVVNTPGFMCSALDLTFSNFSAMNAGNTPSPSVFLVSVSESPSQVVLNFNPSLLVGNQDMWFYFQVTGGVIGVDLVNAGTGVTSIAERVCDSAGITDNVCNGTELATLSAGSGQKAAALFSPQGELFIFKDIGTGADGHLSSFSQSFETPEPVTFGLIGFGLLLLGLVRRRRS